jgi:polyisoprenoid-binding protein YceI
MSARSPDPAYVPDLHNSRWRIDESRSVIGFETKTLYGLQTVKGEFAEFDGSLDLRTDPAIELSVDARSLTTGSFRRDKHLLSADFLDADANPIITFTSTTVTLDGDTLAINGQFTAAGRTMPLGLEASTRREEGELLLDASTIADHRELGMTWNPLGMIRGQTRLLAHARLFREQPPAGSV